METGSSEERPLAAYGLIASTFLACFGGALAAAARRGSLPERVGAADIALLGAGTFKLSRLITQDAVTSFVRAPFVEYEGMEGVTDPKERPRGSGLRRALGQLLLCPSCTGTWVAATLTLALVTAPRATRVACASLAALTLADALNLARQAASSE